MQKHSLKAAFQNTLSGAAKSPFGRKNRGKYRLAGALAASAIAGAGLYYTLAEFRSRGVNTHEAATQSPAYQFGFAHAALAGCDFAPGAELDLLAAAVQVDNRGILPDDVKAGFSDFHSLQQTQGKADACRQAEQFLGPRSHLRSGVLSPR